MSKLTNDERRALEEGSDILSDLIRYVLKTSDYTTQEEDLKLERMSETLIRILRR